MSEHWFQAKKDDSKKVKDWNDEREFVGSGKRESKWMSPTTGNDSLLSVSVIRFHKVQIELGTLLVFTSA